MLFDLTAKCRKGQSDSLSFIDCKIIAVKSKTSYYRSETQHMHVSGRLGCSLAGCMVRQLFFYLTFGAVREERSGGSIWNTNSKTLFYKDCSLGSVKNLSND